MKIKIAYVIPTLSLGGAEKQQINILNGINTNKFNVKLYILRNKTQLISQIENSNIEIKVCNINSLKDINALFIFIKDIIKYNPHIIHSHMYNANILVRFLKILLPNTKIVNHFHGMSQWLSKAKLFIDKSTSFLVDKFIVVSQKSFDLRVTREKYSKSKMVLLPNSVDFRFNKKIENKKDYSSFVIGMASRLIPLKNIEGAIFMVAQLQKKGIKVKLKIAGDGTHKDKLILYANKLGIQEDIEFVGLVSDMQSFYQKIDIYCISSFTEDLPLSLIEAMIMGKPIIASNVGGIPDIVKNLECTLLIDDYFNLKEIEKIFYFLKKIKKEFCFKHLHNYAMMTFDNKIYLKKLEKLYEIMVNEQ